MADKREDILARILVVASSAPGVVHGQRNEIGLKRNQQPGVVLLDGDEEIVTSQRIKTPVLAPQIMRMRLGLFVQTKDMQPQPAMGTLLNTLRVSIIKTLVNDVPLRTLLGTNGKLEYTGVITDLKAGAAISGEMNLGFTCSYLFDPNA